MRILFMGTPEFAVPALKALAESYEVSAVVTQPDKPGGRGKKLKPPPVKIFAEENQIPVFQPENINLPESVSRLKSYGADIFIVAAYGQILKQDVLSLPPLGCVNIHGSLLPKYRGAAPIQQALLDGETTTGITIMFMDKTLDGGDMVLKKELNISDSDDFISLHDKMAELGAEAMLEALPTIADGTCKPVAQQDSMSSYAHMIKKETGNINWFDSSGRIINLIRAMAGWPCAYSALGPGRQILKIWRGESVDGYSDGQPGEIIGVFKDAGILVKTGDGAVLLKEIQAHGGKRMDSRDFLRGHRLEVGDKFSSA